MVSMLDVVIVIYNYAVVISGAYMVAIAGVDDRLTMFVLGGILAVFWTLYFRWDMVSRIVNQATEDEAAPSHDVG